jgi:3-isopropylmalate dehydrogenase
MFGDILSDLTAELSGSLGLGGSLNAGDLYAMGQAAHGSAPDIAGQDIANPFSLITSASMLLNWLGQRHQLPIYIQAAKLIDLCIQQAIDAKETTIDIGGSLGTFQTGKQFIQRIQAA